MGEKRASLPRSTVGSELLPGRTVRPGVGRTRGRQSPPLPRRSPPLGPSRPSRDARHPGRRLSARQPRLCHLLMQGAFTSF